MHVYMKCQGVERKQIWGLLLKKQTNKCYNHYWHCETIYIQEMPYWIQHDLICVQTK